jgi:hypothetical protein
MKIRENLFRNNAIQETNLLGFFSQRLLAVGI